MMNGEAAFATCAPLSVLLATASLEPSGLGEHMITLARAFPPEVRATLVFPATCAGLNTLRRAREAGLPAFALPLAALRHGTASFGAALDRVRPDIVHAHAGVPEEAHMLAVAARAWGARAVIRTEHVPYTLRTLNVKRPHLEAAYARGVQCVDRIICVSEGARQTYRMAPAAAPFSVIHNGVVPRPARSPRDSVRAALGIGDEPLILAVGRLVLAKSPKTLVNALPRLLAVHPSAIVAVAGRGPLEPALRARAQARGVSRHILFLGERSDVPDLMRAADVLCTPSRFEGHPLVILEALAAGLPVVASRVIGNSEAIRDGETGLLFPFDHAAILARTLARLLADRALMARLATAGQRWVAESCTAARMASETVEVYRQALAGRAVRVNAPAAPASGA